MNGSVSLSSSPQVCITPHYGLIAEGGVTGNVLYWETSTTPFQFYNKDVPFGAGVSTLVSYLSEGVISDGWQQCFGGTTEPVSGHARRDLGTISRAAGQPPRMVLEQDQNRGARIIERSLEEGRVINKRNIKPMHEVIHGPIAPLPTSSSNFSLWDIDPTLARGNETDSPRLTKRIDVPFISGAFNCPAVNDQIGQDNTDNDIYSDGRWFLAIYGYLILRLLTQPVFRPWNCSSFTKRVSTVSVADLSEVDQLLSHLLAVMMVHTFSTFGVVSLVSDRYSRV